MIRYLDSENMGRSRLGWLDSRFHFSFAEYYNPENINFGALRVINDDLIAPGTGFDVHPHDNMEIITYVVEGELTHEDSMGNKRVLKRGQVQYLSAGTGITHSEYNYGKEVLRLLQIWIYPDNTGYTPKYGDCEFKCCKDRLNKWLYIASDEKDTQAKAPVKLHQDANIYATILSKGKIEKFNIQEGRQAYIVVVEGEAKIKDKTLKMRDAIEIIEENIEIEALEAHTHLLVIEMAKE